MAGKTRILEVSEATAGGTRRHLTDLALNLDPSRFDVSVACAMRRDPDFESDARLMRNRGIPVHVVDMRREIEPVSDVKALGRLVQLMRGGRFDVVHTHSSKAGFLGRLAARLARVPFVVHTPHVFAFQMGGGSIRRRFYVELERLAARLTHRIVCVSEAERTAALGWHVAPGPKFTIIPNGIDSAAYSADGAAGGSIRQLLGIPEGARVVGSVGRFVRQKGLEFLLQAGRKVLDSYPEARFLIVGEGEWEGRLRAMADRMGLGGRCVITPAHRCDRSVYSAFDVFVMPSLWEGLPYAILEAMASARPIVATTVGGLGEVIRTERSGLLVAPADADVLAGAIVRLLADPARALQMGAEARREVESRFQLSGMIASLEALYQEAGKPR